MLAKLRGGDSPAAGDPADPADRYVANAVESQYEGYPIVESDGDEDAWGLTGRD